MRITGESLLVSSSSPGRENLAFQLFSVVWVWFLLRFFIFFWNFYVSVVIFITVLDKKVVYQNAKSQKF